MKHRSFLIVLLFLATTMAFSQTLKPTATMALLQGVVKNFKNKVLPKEKILLIDTKTKKSYSVNTDAAGKFEVLVPVGAIYSLQYKNFTADVEYTKMELPSDPDATYEVEIKIDPPKDFTLENVFFDTGKATLKPTSNKALTDLVEILKLKNTMVVEIQGHTDNVGKPEDNLKLSRERAEAVKNFLLSKGIEATRVTAKGYGDTTPVADNSTDAGKAKNRRTSLKVIKE
ncbi:MAG: outer membrane protein/peptidoglycan-associated protein [Bacteroidetes bacterium]|jgi:outer membrane protein OmpA-like peptidoglycan-associated protein|nr:outer membrane protein/peptidoglycan-associated protein [Bacteroidota bacterium]